MQEKRKKSGALARIGLFIAIAQVFGVEAANKKFERRKKGNHARGQGRNGMSGVSGAGRPGFKLVKKMARRPENHGWKNQTAAMRQKSRKAIQQGAHS